jgi:hypothetical protein
VNVYVVLWHCLETYDVENVFSSEEAARDYILDKCRMDHLGGEIAWRKFPNGSSTPYNKQTGWDCSSLWIIEKALKESKSSS